MNSLRKTTRRCKDITLTHLVDVLRKIGEKSLESPTGRYLTYDFSLSSEYVRNQGLKHHIAFETHSGRDNALPLNSEHHIYDMDNILVRDLVIKLDDWLIWNQVEDWAPVSSAKLHFERCRFQVPTANEWIFKLPWCGSFRFYKNEFCFPASKHSGHWLFIFVSGSSAWFEGNDFTGNNIQTSCNSPVANLDDSNVVPLVERPRGRISFVANRGVHEFMIREGYSDIEITGMNRIDRLNIDLIVEGDGAKRTSTYLGPREKIDPSFHFSLEQRYVFITMRQLAAMNNDSRQLTVLDRYLERIEYFLNKGEDTPSLLEFFVWFEYWQDRVLYAWRRWSSDFYKSWFRPLAMLVIGYLLLNAIPTLMVESFSISHWINFTLRPVTEIAAYEVSLGRIVGSEYDTVPASTKTLLKLLGLIELVWVGVWGFAFAKSIRR